MTVADALESLARSYGIITEFYDLTGTKRATSTDTVKALLRAVGLELDSDAMILEAHTEREARHAARQFPRELIVARGEALVVQLADVSEWHLMLDGMTELSASGGVGDSIALPPLASGLHTLTVRSSRNTEDITLVATPPASPSIKDMTGMSRLWGLNAALYGLRSKRNCGVGDFEDLARLAEIAAGQGASFLGINPVHAIGWSDRETISPYSPSHRGFLNTSHIAVDRIVGLENLAAAQGLLRKNSLSLAPVRASKIIDYVGHGRVLRDLLGALFEVFTTEAGSAAKAEFDAFRERGGKALRRFTEFEALSEVHGPDWRHWPIGLQTANRPAVASVVAGFPGRTEFHAWLQWVAATQLTSAQSRARQAGMSLGLYLDLAVGPRRGAAETWCECESVACGVSIGAPPDHLSPAGQNWDLAAYAPERLIDDRFRALRRILRETMRRSGVLRIDHVLGMNRSYWIPDDGSPGGYIRQPLKSLLAVVAIEAERAGTVVVGEDLGLVPPGFREEINERGLYSYSVLQYEKNADGRIRRPAEMRPYSLACFGTHDTPTLKGFWTGRDIDWWRKLGWINNAAEAEARRRREIEKRELLALNETGSRGDASCHDANLIASVHTALAQAPVAMVSIQLDDILGEVEAQNLPGTVQEHPNWRRRCKVSIEQIGGQSGLVQTAGIMGKHGRGKPEAIARKESR